MKELHDSVNDETKICEWTHSFLTQIHLGELFFMLQELI